MQKKFCFLCLLFSSCIFFASAKESQGWDGVVNKIVDGNTVTIKHGDSNKTVKLYGIDAPDLAQSFGDEAKKFLGNFILDKTVKVTAKKSSIKNSAEVFILSGYLVSVNKKMIKKGFAWSTVKEYSTLEATAKRKHLGLWSESNPTPPAEYRQKALKQQRKKKQQEQVEANAAFEEKVLNDYLAGVRHSTLNNKEINDRLRKSSKKNNPKKTAANDINTIDFITINTLLIKRYDNNDSKLRVSLHYKSSPSGKNVYWKNPDVTCECTVTGYFANDTSNRIAREEKSLNSSTEDFYINIPKEYLRRSSLKKLSRGYVECTISTGQEDFEVYDNF